MRTLLNRAALAPLLLFISISAQAQTWVIDKDDSQVIFKYSYAGTPYQGAFTNIDAEFDIDPSNPTECDFDVTIHMDEIAIDDDETRSYLLDVDLFDVAQFPTSTFEAENCRMLGPNRFLAEGMLTIRSETHPISFPFNLDVDRSGDQPRFHMTSEVTIERLKYGVGQGYMANTADIPNDVDVEVDVYAVQQ